MANYIIQLIIYSAKLGFVRCSGEEKRLLFNHIIFVFSDVRHSYTITISLLYCKRAEN